MESRYPKTQEGFWVQGDALFYACMNFGFFFAFPLQEMTESTEIIG